MSNFGLKSAGVVGALALTAFGVLQCASNGLAASQPSPFDDAYGLIAGPAYSEFRLTLEAGRRTEIASPFYYDERREDVFQWGVPPLMSYTQDRVLPSAEFDFLYPIFTYDRYGKEYRVQIGQLLNFAGGVAQDETNKHRFSLFPFYLQQRSSDPALNYTSVLPFYGRLQNRLFRDEIFYVMMPLYVETRKKDVETRNFVFPLFHVRHGEGLRGWQFWPVVGHEHKVPTLRTNTWGDEVEVPGHDRKFVLWPFFLNQRAGLGSTNEEHTQAFIPLYSFTRSPLRDATAVPFILGWSSIDDRGKKYREVGAPWPLVVFRKGESTHIRRFWPIYSHGTNEFLESTWYLWPVYKYNRVHAEALDRDRMRILLYLYSDTHERNTESGAARRRRELWPLYLYRQDWDGSTRLQILAPLEPILPNNKSIERNYSPIWSIWRAEKNARTGQRSQSLLWNLYRRETSADGSKTSALFGLIQHSNNPTGRHWRFFYWPVKNAASARDGESSAPDAGHAE